MKKVLQKFGLNPDNSVIIGSGILQALKIRKSNDTDLVVSREVYNRLKKSGNFTVKHNPEHKFGPEILKGDNLEIGVTWTELNTPHELEYFKKYSVIINGVRYINLDFLYKVKKEWLKQKSPRQKDIDDVKLIERFKDQIAKRAKLGYSVRTSTF